MRELRDYQAEGVRKIYAAWERGVLRPAIVYATGLGKTDVIAKIATDAVLERRAQGRKACVIILADRRKLLAQIDERLKMHLPDVSVGWVQAQRNEVNREVLVCSVQTLAKAKRQAQIRQADLLIVDECHGVMADGYQDVLRWAGCLDLLDEDDNVTREAFTRCLGVTATMIRGDKRRLGDVWQEVVDERDFVWGIANGWLVEPVGRLAVVRNMDLSKVKSRKGEYGNDFAAGELGEILARAAEEVVAEWKQEAIDEHYPEGRSTLAFTSTIASATAYRDAFNNAGIKAEMILGATPDVEREAIMARHAAGITRVRVDVKVGAQGEDMPWVSCVIPRPTQQLGFLAQMIGRGVRLLDTKMYPAHPPKRHCLILDPTGRTQSAKLVNLTDLSPTFKRDTSKLDALPCGLCGGVLVGGKCAACDAPPEPAVKREKLIPRGKLVGYVDHRYVQITTLPFLLTKASQADRCAGRTPRCRFIRKGDRYFFVWHNRDDDSYTAASVNIEGDRRVVEPLDGAIRVKQELRAIIFLERAVKEYRGQLAKGKRGDHGGKGSKLLRELAHAFGFDGDRHSAAASSDLIDIEIASARLDSLVQ